MFLCDRARKVLILGYIDKFNFPFIFFKFFRLLGTANPLNPALYFYQAACSVIFKKFYTMTSAFS